MNAQRKGIQYSSVADPDLNRSVDPGPDRIRIRIQRQEWAKKEKQLRSVMF
jgi:hypothetical protein